LVDSIGELPKEDEDLPAVENRPVQVNADQFKKFFIGFVNQSTGVNHYNDIYPCFTDVQHGAADLEAAIVDFKQKEDMTKIVDGLMHVGKILVNVPEDVRQCTKTKSVILALSKWVGTFKNPAAAIPTIMTNMGGHYVDIIHQLDQFNQASAKQDYTSAGADISKILVDAIGPLPKKVPVTTESVDFPHINADQFKKFFIGFVNQATGVNHYNDIYPCFSDVQNGAADLEAAIVDFKQK